MLNRDIGAVIRKLNARPNTKAIKLPSIAGFLESGTPDILCVSNGVPYLIEVKHGRAQPTPIQRKRAEEWRAAGVVVATCRSPAEVLALVGQASGQQHGIAHKQAPYVVDLPSGLSNATA